MTQFCFDTISHNTNSSSAGKGNKWCVGNTHIQMIITCMPFLASHGLAGYRGDQGLTYIHLVVLWVCGGGGSYSNVWVDNLSTQTFINDKGPG